ncbi:MAG: YciI family protein [Actinomycetota bacterium]|nr:YciI family protein [Actinomycetota bacterium]
MKYVLLIYDNPDTREAFFGEGASGLMGEVDALMRELAESGELVGAEALADPSNTKTVRVRGGVPAITDGPFAEAKEHLGGYLVVDCEGPERATEIAARWPNARFCAMEVRPIMDEAGTEM